MASAVQQTGPAMCMQTSLSPDPPPPSHSARSSQSAELSSPCSMAASHYSDHFFIQRGSKADHIINLLLYIRRRDKKQEVSDLTFYKIFKNQT